MSQKSSVPQAVSFVSQVLKRHTPALERRIQSQLRAGKGILKVAAECGVGSGTVQRIKREMEESRPLASDAAA